MVDRDGYRPNVGIILINARNQVFWGKRIRQDSWQFPQGGIQHGESPVQAMYRELQEEIGLMPCHVRILGRTRDWMRYDVPQQWIKREWRSNYKGQKQIWFLLRLLGRDCDVSLRASGHPEFDAWRWTDYWIEMNDVIEFKRDVYNLALNELARYLPPLKGESRHGSRRQAKQTISKGDITMKKYAPLAAHPLKVNTSFARPMQQLPEHVELDDPAFNVMTDLNVVSVVNVRAMASMDSANTKMIRYGVRLLLVLDDSDKVVGLVTANDILGDKPIRFLQHMGGTHADILVRDVMTTQRDLEVMMMADVANAKVGQILETLKKAGRQHAMVVEENTDGSQVVCGLFSVTQIARQLGLQVQAGDVAQIFARIEERFGA